MPRKAIGEHTGGHADEEHRQAPHPHRDADEERRVRELEREPAQHDDLADHADGVQDHRGAEPSEVGEPEECQRSGRPFRAMNSGKAASALAPRITLVV